MQFRHIYKIHAINTSYQSQEQKNSLNNGKHIYLPGGFFLLIEHIL